MLLGIVEIQLFSLKTRLVQTQLFKFGMATSLEEGKLWVQTC